MELDGSLTMGRPFNAQRGFQAVAMCGVWKRFCKIVKITKNICSHVDGNPQGNKGGLENIFPNNVVAGDLVSDLKVICSKETCCIQTAMGRIGISNTGLQMLEVCRRMDSIL